MGMGDFKTGVLRFGVAASISFGLVLAASNSATSLAHADSLPSPTPVISTVVDVGTSADPGAVPDVTVATAISAIDGVDVSLVDSAAVVATTEIGETAVDAEVSKVGIEVPVKPSDQLVLTADDGAIRVGLPFGDDAASAEVAGPGVLAYDNHNGTATVPIVRADGTVQINTVISSPDAPTAYVYNIEVPADARIETVGGSLLFVREGALVGGLAPAWAKDANGRQVPTRYEVKGNTITQVVEHNSSFAYPVVADPWIGMNLFGVLQKNRKGTVKGKPVYSGVLSSWGASVYSGLAQGGGLLGAAAGYKIVRSCGWDEWKAALVGSNPAKSLEQQYVCHCRGGYAVWLAGVHWDLEAARPSKPNWPDKVMEHKCNW
jgi:hypothetical protein